MDNANVNVKLLGEAELEEKWDIECSEFPNKIFSYNKREFENIGYIKGAEHISKLLYKPSHLSNSPENTPIKCYIAVKKLEQINDKRKTKNILYEIKSLMMLEKKKAEEKIEINVIQLYGYERENGYYLLYMEWMDFSLKDLHTKGIAMLLCRQTLDDKIKNKLNILIGYITVEIIDALCYLCSCETPIIHRDVKPGNILLTYTGKVKLADFGEARFENTKTTGGTPRYRPPEAFIMDKIAEDELQKYDVFSLGVVVLEYFCVMHYYDSRMDPNDYIYCGMHPYDYIKKLQSRHFNGTDEEVLAEEGELTKWSEEDSVFTQEKLIDDVNFKTLLSLSLRYIETRATPFELQEIPFYRLYKKENGDPRTGVAMILNELKIQSDPCIIPSVSNGSVDERKPIGFKPIDLDGGYGRCVVLVSILIIAFADGFVYSFKDIMQPFISEFVEIDNKVSLIQSLLTSLMLATGPLSSAMCNRFGCRITTIIGAFVASTGCAISYKANSMEFLMFSVGIVMGTGFGLMYCPAIVMVTMYFKRIRSFAIGITICGAGMGAFVFSNVHCYILDNIVNKDWQTMFIIHAGFFLCLGFVLLCVPCKMLYRPIEFEVIYDEEEEEMKKITNNDKETRNQKEWQDHHVSIDLQLNERPEPIAEEDEDKASLHITDDKKENRMVMKMMDLSLFADPVFLLFVNSNFLTTIIFISLPTFMRNALRDHNLISQSEVYSENYYRISESEVYRLAGFFGLIVISLVGDSALPFKYGKDCARNRLWIYSWFLMISGVASAFAFLMVGLWVLISYCIIFGSFMISYRFTPVILLDLIGIERFTNAFGLLLLVQGIATFIGLHFGVMDIQWRYDWIIVFCGICLFLSGIMLFNIPFMTKHQNEVGFKNSAEKHGERPLLH